MSITAIMSQIQSLSAADKLLLNQQLATSMLPAAKASAKSSSRKGKPAAAGTLAWTAYVAHVQKTMPERFAPPAQPKERLSIAGAIRLENPEDYKSFCEKFIAEMPARDSDSESVAESVATAPSVTSDKPKRVISEEQKAKMKAGRESAAAAKKEAVANGTYVAKSKTKGEKPAKVKAEKPAKAAKAAKAVAVAAPVATVDSSLEKITVDGVTYWLNTANNNLYDLESDESMGAFVGSYTPEDADNVINFDAEEA